MCSQSKGICSANISASMCGKIRTIPALLHSATLAHLSHDDGFYIPLAKLLYSTVWPFAEPTQSMRTNPYLGIGLAWVGGAIGTGGRIRNGRVTPLDY